MSLSAPDGIDFIAAARFLAVAQQAHDDGDGNLCLAACKMVALALNLTESPRAAHLHTAHLEPASAAAPG